MTNNQLHGKKFEDLIKGCGLFLGSADGGRSHTAAFDIEAKFDKVLGLPTSVKSTGSNVVGLSDARNFFSISQKYRMLVGFYTQVDLRKQFGIVHQFVITTKVLDTLRGKLTLDDVTRFHQGLLLTNFPAGSHLEARQWAREQKFILSEKQSMVTLNPKIDSKKQRRLQCSVLLSDLIDVCKTNGQYYLHDDTIGDLVLPIIQVSSARNLP